MNRLLRSLIIGCPLTLLAPRESASQQFYAVDPRATYLRTNADAPASPTIISLSSLPQQLFLMPSGQYGVAGGGPLQPGHFWAVFSSTNALLADNGVVNRVVGAIDVGAPLNQTAIAGGTFYGGIPMDIPQDFFIPDEGLLVNVPAAALFLFVGVPDEYYADNYTPNQSQLGVTVTTVTPEPASGALIATGLAAIAFIARRRRESIRGDQV